MRHPPTLLTEADVKKTRGEAMAFLAEYKDLCLKHGMAITAFGDCGNVALDCSGEVTPAVIDTLVEHLMYRIDVDDEDDRPTGW